MKVRFLVIFCLLVMPQVFGVQSSVDLFLQANRLYAAHQYDKAYILYEKANALEPGSPALYYNLGNTAFKLQRQMDALTWYEKARQLEPGDADLLHNLRFVYQYFELPLGDNQPNFGILSFWKKFINSFSLHVLLLTYLIWLVGITLLVWAWRFGWISIRWSGFLLIAGLLLVGSSAARWRPLLVHDQALISVDRVEVKSGPDSSLATLFTLHQGRALRILDEQGGWAYIQVQGYSGWLPLSAISSL